MLFNDKYPSDAHVVPIDLERNYDKLKMSKEAT